MNAGHTLNFDNSIKVIDMMKEYYARQWKLKKFENFNREDGKFGMETCHWLANNRWEINTEIDDLELYITVPIC